MPDEIVPPFRRHPLFNGSTERGLAIRKMFGGGMIRLQREGRLEPIYYKWGHQ